MSEPTSENLAEKYNCLVALSEDGKVQSFHSDAVLVWRSHLDYLRTENADLKAENERLRKWLENAWHWVRVASDASDEIERGKRLIDVRLCLDAALSTPQETEP